MIETESAIKLGNRSCHANMYYPLKSQVLHKKTEIKLQNTLIRPVISCMSEEQTLGVAGVVSLSN